MVRKYKYIVLCGGVIEINSNNGKDLWKIQRTTGKALKEDQGL